MRRWWTIGLTTALALGVAAQEAAPQPAAPVQPTYCRGGGGPAWQSAEAAGLQAQVRTAQWQLYALQQAAEPDAEAVAAKQAEVNALRERMWQLRDQERAAFRQQIADGTVAPRCQVAGAGWQGRYGRGGRGGRGGAGFSRGGRWQAQPVAPPN